MTDDRVEQLLDELRSEGRVVHRGRFTLSSEQARAKLERHQFADPHAYVLALLKTAVLCNAGRIDFSIDSNRLRTEFDGDLFATTDLDDLFAGLLEDDESSPRRRRLAMALASASRLKPKSIRMTSGSTFLEIRAGREDALEELSEATATTVIEVSHRGAGFSWARWWRRLTGATREQRLLEQRAQYAPLRSTINDALITDGELRIAHALLTDEVSHRYRGIVAVTADRRRASVRLLHDGVWTDTVELEDAPRGILVVVEAKGARTDLSQTKLVRDESLDRVLTAADRAHRKLLASVAERIKSGDLEASTLKRLQRWFPKAIRRSVYSFRSRHFFLDEPSGVRLARIPMWPNAFQPGEDEITVADLLRDWRRHDEVLYASRPLPERERLSGRHVPLVRDRRSARFLQRLFPRIVNIARSRWRKRRRDRSHREERKWHRGNRGSWRNRPGV